MSQDTPAASAARLALPYTCVDVIDAELRIRGDSLPRWAWRNGYSPTQVCQTLDGELPRDGAMLDALADTLGIASSALEIMVKAVSSMNATEKKHIAT